MKERSNNKYRITKTRDFSQRTIENLENSKIIYREVKKSNEKAV